MEYDHFVRECPSRQANKEMEQIQQMFNMDKDQAMLQTPLIDTDEDELTITPVETRKFKLIRGKDDSSAFLHFFQKLGENNIKVGNNRNNSTGRDCLTSK